MAVRSVAGTVFVVFSATVVVVACANSVSSPEPDATKPTPVDASREAAKDEPPPQFTSGDADVPTKGDCERDVAVGALTISMSTCFVNQHVENRTTKLKFPCGGGAATADFDGHHFTGTVTADDELSLTNVEPFVFYDCDWISTEKIEGNLSKGTLTYSYSEKPKTTCPEPPCTADGNLDVTAGEIVVVR